MPQDLYLGEIRITIAGTQYYEDDLVPGEVVYFEREPDNRYDRHSIRVDNAYHEATGHIPRRTAAWLAPLLDVGRVRLAGAACDASEQPDITVATHLTPQAQVLLEPLESPEDAAAAFHETVRRAWIETAEWTEPKAIRGLGRRLERAAGRDTWPLTRLLLALFPWRAAQLRPPARKSAAREHPTADELAALLEAIRLGEPTHHHNLTFFPLLPANGNGNGGGGEAPYELLPAATEAGTLEVTEVSAAGSVPELAVVNRGSNPVLIPEGSILVGAKQNRVVNVTVLVPAAETTVIPVSCVERGRWRSTSRKMGVAPFANPGLRREKAASIKQSYLARRGRRADQGRVWHHVDAVSFDLSYCSPSADLAAGFEATHERRNAYRKALAKPKGAVGVIATVGDRVIGLDCFGRPEVLDELWESVTDGYFLEAVRSREAQETGSPETVEAFLISLRAGIEISDPEVGLGSSLDVTAEELAGGGLVYGGELCHLGAFGS